MAFESRNLASIVSRGVFKKYFEGLSVPWGRFLGYASGGIFTVVFVQPLAYLLKAYSSHGLLVTGIVEAQSSKDYIIANAKMVRTMSRDARIVTTVSAFKGLIRTLSTMAKMRR